ncbi:glycosyltransferase family 2 protein [Candidatus Bathyarchaeota archaeon A05DMB-2]|jgi:glycosyltransferase involved in cell wall biosynthesis|nr:glycosyltransferase family 2 protein [Candidatus Bathyarchaeota archaeon A05DMB-2]
MQAVDVVLLTKNSEHLLDKCLASIFESVPVNNLIIVDGFSNDGTMEIVNRVKQKFGNVKVLKVDGSRAKARQRGIAQVTTELFMFVDSDVVLCRDWYRKAQRYVDKDVGAVWGINIDVIPNVKDKRIIKFQSLIARQCFGLRGGMHDTLIRRDAVQGIEIPEELHAYEDSYIINWIKGRGYRTVIGDDIYCLHFKAPGNWSLQNGVSQAIIEFRCGLIYSHMVEYMFYYPFFMFYWFVQFALQGARSFSSH